MGTEAMKTIAVKIDRRDEHFHVAESSLLGIVRAQELEIQQKGPCLVEASLRSPIGSAPLETLVQAGEKVVIITSDVTRPCPSHQILPAILERLALAGVKDEDVTIVFALGAHRLHSEEERLRLVGQAVYDRITCIDGDMTDVVHMGTTSRGTPVEVTRLVAKADRRICVGNVEYHYFAGYSGGAKAIMPGVSTRRAIQSNHQMMLDPAAKTGHLDGNPVRADLEEAIAHCPIDFIVNVVLDEAKEIIHCVSGHFIQAHRAACKFLDRFYRVEIPERADIVIVSQGGYPKDLNLYQSQKALDNAQHAVKQGGVIILVGSCKEGYGEAVFEDWVKAAKKPSDLCERVSQGFELGGHKAAAIAQVMERAEVFLVSEMEDAKVRDIFMTPFHSVQAALDEATKRFAKPASVLVMPYGGSSLPQWTHQGQ